MMSSADPSLSRLPPPLLLLRTGIRTWWDRWLQWVPLGLAWLLAWLLIIPGPPVTFGLFHVANELVAGRTLGFSGLIEGVRLYFVKSWLWMLVNIAVTILLLVNARFYIALFPNWAITIGLIITSLGLIWFMLQLYALPFLMIQEKKSLWHAWRNAAVAILASPGYMLTVWLGMVLIIVPSTITMIPIILGGPGLVAVIACQAVRDRIQLFEQE
jgi:uncharacterized membrane protein YesL